MSVAFASAVLVVLAAVAFAGSGPSPASADGAPTGGRWTVTYRLVNTSPFRLELLSNTVSEMSTWERTPPDVLLPETVTEAVLTNSAPAQGVVALLTYGAYTVDSHDFVGTVVVKGGIDCTVRTPWACLDYHRWTEISCSGNEVVNGRWSDNAGPPGDFWATYEIMSSGSGSCVALRTSDPAADLSADLGAADAEPAPPQGRPWALTANVFNNTPFELRLRSLWSSEATTMDSGLTKRPPIRIQPASSLLEAWTAINTETNHGPAVWALYDVYDPSTQDWIGSYLAESATDCTSPNPEEGCLAWRDWSDSVAQVVPGYRISEHATSVGLPPLNHITSFELFGQPEPEADPPGSSPTSTSSTPAAQAGTAQPRYAG